MIQGLVILLPPSEGKAESEKGTKLNLASLSFPKLKAPRAQLIKELIDLAQKQPAKLQKILGLSKKQLPELEMNKNLLKRPTTRAIEIYSGVLYEALDFAKLPKPAQNWIGKRVFISSALFGLVGAFDKIPAYRLSGDQALPTAGSLKTFWIKNSGTLLDKTFEKNLILDLRSGVYASAWQPGDELKENFVIGKIVQKQRVNGKTVYKVVSHHNKATKGKLVAALAKAQANPKTPRDLENLLKKLGFDVKLELISKNKTNILTIVMP